MAARRTQLQPVQLMSNEEIKDKMMSPLTQVYLESLLHMRDPPFWLLFILRQNGVVLVEPSI